MLWEGTKLFQFLYQCQHGGQESQDWETRMIQTTATGDHTAKFDVRISSTSSIAIDKV